eukprot:scaffold160_cov264-Prasinococcus_capsulatus_cf.AAC.2
MHPGARAVSCARWFAYVGLCSSQAKAHRRLGHESGSEPRVHCAWDSDKQVDVAPGRAPPIGRVLSGRGSCAESIVWRSAPRPPIASRPAVAARGTGVSAAARPLSPPRP